MLNSSPDILISDKDVVERVKILRLQVMKVQKNRLFTDGEFFSRQTTLKMLEEILGLRELKILDKEIIALTQHLNPESLCKHCGHTEKDHFPYVVDKDESKATTCIASVLFVGDTYKSYEYCKCSSFVPNDIIVQESRK